MVDDCRILKYLMRRLLQHCTKSSIILTSKEESVWKTERQRASDSVENYAHLVTTALRNDDIQEFDSKWDGILLSMTKIPHDDILEGLYK